MKYIILSIMFTVVAFSCHTSKTKYIATNDVVRKAQLSSLYTDQVVWKKLNQKFDKICGNSNNTDSLLPALQLLINTLGDKHATIRSTKNYYVLASYTGEDSSNDIRKSDYVNSVINNIDSKFICGNYTYGNDIYGQLTIVGIGGQASIDDEAYAMQNCIAHLKNEGVNKWIIDLRNNGGGNMNPMLAGMAPFFEDGFIGGAVDAKDSLVHKYEIIKGDFYDTGRHVYKAKQKVYNCTLDSVVILTSKYTASSGEVVAVAFKGRPNTVFIGEQTAGYTTGNGYEIITDELAMIISQNYYVDRNLMKYTGKVDVDIPIPFIENMSPLEDEQVLRAIDWIEKHD